MTHHRHPLVVSHAACAGLAPENTLAGVRIALDLGVDAIEVDVHSTADGVPVLLHDDTVDRTTNGSGDIRMMTLAEARRLDAGAKQHDGKFQGEPIPTLAEVLQLIAGKAYLNMEIKQPGIEEEVISAVREWDAMDWSIFCSFYSDTIQRLNMLAPKAPAFLLVEYTLPEKNEASPITSSDWPLFLHYRLVTSEIVQELHRQGRRVFVWTVDDEEEMRRLVSLGVDGIGTNFPDRLLKTIDATR